MVFFATTESNILNPDNQIEVSEEIKWFTKDELADPQYNIKASIKCCAEKALEVLSTNH